MAEFPKIEEMGEKVAEKALDEFLYDGKSIREWAQIIASKDAISRQAVLDILKEKWNMFLDANDAMQESIDTIESLRPVSSSENPNKCDDCISRQAALDAIEREFFKGDAISEIKKLPPVTPQETVTEFADRCRECGAYYGRLLNQKWIPVSERLPKIADVYRVTRYYPNNVMNPNYLVDACFSDGSDTWYNDNRINHERDYANNVIAWQENPEPYKVEPKEREK